MAYFTAALARSSSGWRPREVDLDAADDPAALGDLLRAAAVGDGTVLLLIEHEDEWFAVVRCDGEEDVRIFVSDVEGAVHSPYATALAGDVELIDADGEESTPTGAGGDADLLADFGTPAETLLDLCGEDGVLPTEATDTIAANAGFGDILDALR